MSCNYIFHQVNLSVLLDHPGFFLSLTFFKPSLILILDRLNPEFTHRLFPLLKA